MRKFLAVLAAVLAISAGNAAADWPQVAQTWHEIQNGAIPYTNPATGTLDIRPGSLIANNITAVALATPTVTSVTPTLTKVGSVTTVAGASLVDGDYFTVKYAPGNTIPIEFDATPGNGTTGGRIPYVFAPGDTADQIRDGLITLINAAAPTQLTAVSGGAATITLALNTPGAAGDTNTENVANAGFAVTGFVNPTAATTYGYKAVSYLADGTSTAASTEVTTAAGHATLSASNYNTVVFAPSAGSVSTRLYRTTGGAAPPKLLYTGTALTFTDTGAAGTAQTPATVNTTGIVLAGNGSATKPSYSFVSDPTAGVYTLAGGVALAGGGGGWLLAGPGGTQVVSAAALGWSASVLNDAYKTSLTSPAAATLQLGAAASATPVAQVLQAQGSRGGTDTDVAGANLTIRPGAGTGAAAGSQLLFQTPTVTTTGTTAQTQTTRLTIASTSIWAGAQQTLQVYPTATDASEVGDAARLYKNAYLSRATLGSKSKVLTDAVATDVFTATLADGAMTGGEIIYRVTASIAAQKQNLSGTLRFSAVRDNVTYDCDVSEVGTQTTSIVSGTLTGAWTCTAAAGVLTLKANFDSSLTAPTVTMNYRVDSTDASLVITPL